MTYEERCRTLGIERPKSLVEGFDHEIPNVAIGKEQTVFSRNVGEIVKPPMMDEDLSHLNPPSKTTGDRMKKWWQNLSPEQRQEITRRRQDTRRATMLKRGSQAA